VSFDGLMIITVGSGGFSLGLRSFATWFCFLLAPAPFAVPFAGVAGAGAGTCGACGACGTSGACSACDTSGSCTGVSCALV
jgi:hypothetical protein